MHTTRGIQSLIHRARAAAVDHPVTTFLVLVFGLGFPLMSLPVLAHHGAIPGESLPASVGLDAERLASLLLVFGALVPSALWVTWAADGRDGVRALIGRMFRWRSATLWWITVAIALPALTLAFTLLLGGSLQPVDIGGLLAGQTLGLLLALGLVNLWEEAAWAGVLQSRLQERQGLVRGALLTTIPFALVHMPLQFLGDFTVGSLLAAFATLLIVSVWVRLLVGVVLRGTGGSVFAVALVHALFNRSNNADGIVATAVEGDARGLAALLAVLVVLTGSAITLRRRATRASRLGVPLNAATAVGTALAGASADGTAGTPVIGTASPQAPRVSPT